jgi:hypothetical protein
MNKPPDFTSGLGGYGPWPDTDPPGVGADPSPYYKDGYANRAPAGCHVEGPADYWIDCMVYPDRSYANSEPMADMLDHNSRFFRVSEGNITGKKPGPEN